MLTRKPIVAGQFYPGHYDSCVDEINQWLEARTLSEELPETIVAGIVPHAGWTFSGALAALVFSAIRHVHEKVNSFVIFGAAHGYAGRVPAVFQTGSWTTPLGDIRIDEDLADAVLSSDTAVADPQPHAAEHSIEVQVPFIQYLFPGAKIVPIIVPPTDNAVALGTSVGEVISGTEKKIICIGSTDLTHYGPRYGFIPQGTGAEALQWAGEVNDRKFIDLALKLEPQDLLTNALENCNACGPGAAAAAIAAAKKLGKTRGLLLAQADSNEVMVRTMGASGADSVGYAAIIF